MTLIRPARAVFKPLSLMSADVIEFERLCEFELDDRFGEQGWGIWRGPEGGEGLEGEEARDPRTSRLVRLEMTHVRFEHMLKESDRFTLAELVSPHAHSCAVATPGLWHGTTGEERRRRLVAASFVLVDAGLAPVLCEHPQMIPLRVRSRVLSFESPVLRSPNGERCTLCLLPAFDRGARPRLRAFSLGRMRDQDSLSVVISPGAA